jgi:hypothetical protein
MGIHLEISEERHGPTQVLMTTSFAAHTFSSERIKQAQIYEVVQKAVRQMLTVWHAAL